MFSHVVCIMLCVQVFCCAMSSARHTHAHTHTRMCACMHTYNLQTYIPIHYHLRKYRCMQPMLALGAVQTTCFDGKLRPCRPSLMPSKKPKCAILSLPAGPCSEQKWGVLFLFLFFSLCLAEASEKKTTFRNTRGSAPFVNPGGR